MPYGYISSYHGGLKLSVVLSIAGFFGIEVDTALRPKETLIPFGVSRFRDHLEQFRLWGFLSQPKNEHLSFRHLKPRII